MKHIIPHDEVFKQETQVNLFSHFYTATFEKWYEYVTFIVAA